MRNRKLFIGQTIRELRDTNVLTQAGMASKLSISTSYLNQLENNQRHVTASVLLSLAEVFDISIASLSDNDSDRLLADLLEAIADPLFKGAPPSSRELKMFAQGTPNIARSFLNMHQAMRGASERLAEIDDTLERSGILDEPTPFEEVRDFFHYNDNYIHILDIAAETLAKQLNAVTNDHFQALLKYLDKDIGIHVVLSDGTDANTPIREFDASSAVLTLNRMKPRSTHIFQMAHQIALIEHHAEIEQTIEDAKFRSQDAKAICRIGLANYFAGACMMPYTKFLDFAVEARHDLQIIARHFEASLDQVAHRLSTLQRPAQKGVPFFFARVDQAGNITKRHSATKLQFARFGSTCPLWIVHSAFASPGKICRQLAETPDGAKYLCLAIEIKKDGLGFRDPVQRYALSLGCEIKHANQLVYGDDMDIQRAESFEPIGISCRICERPNCHQRAVPPLKRPLEINPNKRSIIPYSFQ
ncbi:MAG: DUF2083 domain-containing protein [Rhizobiales bacterium]|nr:DUF2083 domain-containing protein [Hyphomicrobiales bacterium]